VTTSSSASPPFVEDVSVGDELPPLTTVVTSTQLFLFSAATLNPHRIHYDRGWAVEVEGFRDVVVHGPLHGALMTRLVTDWIGPEGRVVTYSVTHRRPAFAGDELRITGTVVGRLERDGRQLIAIEVTETDAGGERLGSAEITVQLPSRRAPT
jgi:hydroxyacyl-ACP dehydratase HTD2-like protein with hotdog domain